MTKINLVKLSKYQQELEEIFYLAVDLPRDYPVQITPYIHLLELKRFHYFSTYFFEIFLDGTFKLTKNGIVLEIYNEAKIRAILDNII